MPKFDFQSQFSMLKGKNLSNFVPPFENSTTRITISSVTSFAVQTSLDQFEQFQTNIFKSRPIQTCFYLPVIILVRHFFRSFKLRQFNAILNFALLSFLTAFLEFLTFCIAPQTSSKSLQSLKIRLLEIVGYIYIVQTSN